MWIEHRVLQSKAPAERDSYGNCYYACRFCNSARQARALTNAAGQRLLDPCADAWADHFEDRQDQLRPLDDDARYTHEAYDLDDPRKRQFRKDRRERIDEALRELAEVPALIDRLHARAEVVARSERSGLLDLAKVLTGNLRKAKDQLRRYRAIPSDRDDACRCSPMPALGLPAFLEPQCEEVALWNGAAEPLALRRTHP